MLARGVNASMGRHYCAGAKRDAPDAVNGALRHNFGAQGDLCASIFGMREKVFARLAVLTDAAWRPTCAGCRHAATSPRIFAVLTPRALSTRKYFCMRSRSR